MREVVSFLAVVEHGSFTRAARALHSSQPSVSRHLGDLERKLGRDLVVRSTPRVAVTDAGQVAVAAFRRFIADLDLLRGD